MGQQVVIAVQNYIIGIGNTMRGDDGVGSYIIDYIHDHYVQDNFCVLDFAADSWKIISLFHSGTERILIIDCCCMGLSSGASQVFALKSVQAQEMSFTDSHQSGLMQILHLADKAGYFIPDISILAIEPESMEFATPLSTRLKDKLAVYARQAVHFIKEGTPAKSLSMKLL